MFRRTNWTKALSLTFLLLNLIFIWGNSAMSGMDSAQMSGRLLALLERIFGKAENLPLAAHYLRKLAHLTEFAALGFILSWFWHLRQRPGKDALSPPLFCGLLAACMDETIQLFSPDRGSSLKDVWIDMAGICLGFLIFRLLSAPARRRDRDKEQI